jgi:hypothetical protein
VSQAWQEPSGNGGLAGPGWPSPAPGTANARAADELGRVRSAPIWGADGDPDGSQAGGSYPAGSYPAGSYPAGSYPAGSYPAGSYPADGYPAGSDPDDSDPGASDWVPVPGEAEPDRRTSDVGRSHRPPLQLTARGAVVGLLLVFFVLLLLSNALGWGWLAGAGFAAGSVAAARYTQRRGLLAVMVTPPLLFCCDLVVVKALTASGNALLSTAGGTALALGSLAPWLFAGVVLALIVAWFRGLPQCVAELRRELHPGLRGGGPGRTAGPPPPVRRLGPA